MSDPIGDPGPSMKTGWPLEADILPMLGGAVAPEGFSFESATMASVLRMEAMTGRSPFLADPSESSLTYDPNPGTSGQRILATDDFMSVSSVEVEWNGAKGRSLTEGRDYVTLPRRRLRDWPIEGFHFLVGMGSQPDSVRITGRVGFFPFVPLDLWEAVAKDVAATAIEAGQEAGGAVKRRQQGDRVVVYGASAPLAERYRSEAQTVFSRYVKVAIDG